MEIIYNEQSNKSGIYKIYNKLNGRIYIGSAKTFKTRITDHLKSLRANKHSNKFLQNDFNKCGEEVFIFEVLEVVEGDKKLRTQREKELIQEYWDNCKNCYNIQKDPESVDRSCFSKTPEETYKIISENMTRIWSDPEQRSKRLETFQSEKFRQKQSEKQKLVSQNPEHGNSAAARKEYFQNPENKESHSKALKVAWSKDNGTRRKLASEIAKRDYEKNKDKLEKAKRLARQKQHILINPEGQTVTVVNLRQFCLANNLNNGCLVQTRQGKAKQHKGWRLV